MEMKEQPYSFFHRLSCAWKGVRHAALHERHLKIHLIGLVLVVVAGSFTGLSTWEWVAIFGISALVLGLELVNAALEETLDLLHPDHHPSAGLAKDMAAGAVLVAAFMAIVIAALIFIPHWTG